MAWGKQILVWIFRFVMKPEHLVDLAILLEALDSVFL